MARSAWKRPGSPIGRKRAAQGEPEIQASLASALEQQGSDAASRAGEGKHPDGCDQPEDATAAGIDRKQSAARGHLAKANQPFTL